MRDVKASQNIVRDLLEEDHAEPLSFINSVNLSVGVDTVAQQITETLDFDQKVFRTKRTIREAFAYLREQIQQKCVFVLLLSDLGSHHTTIPVEVFRGFAFADDLAPFIVINRQDAVSAWSFTALHEVAHLWLGASGVSGSWGDNRIERFCNRVAGAILFPARDRAALAIDATTDFEHVLNWISTSAEELNVSRAMVSYNLMLEGNIDETFWARLEDQFAKDRQQETEQKRDRKRSNAGGSSYYVVRRHQLGKRLINMSRYFVSTGQLSPTKAGVVLGVTPTRVYPLLFPERE